MTNGLEKKNTKKLFSLKHKMTTRDICLLALCVVINYVGGNIALTLRLPIYLDAVGTILAAALLGPLCGMIPGIAGGLIMGLTTDIFSLYYMPVQLIIGFTAGILYNAGFMEGVKKIWAAVLLTIPGTIVSSIITVVLFGGMTSSGSSLIVMLFAKIGLPLNISVVLVQFVTDYADRLCAVFLVAACLAAIPKGALADGTI